MKITKSLKFGTFIWDDEEKSFTIIDSNKNSVTLNKIYGFALMRFIIRIAQKNFLKIPISNKNVEIENIEDMELIEEYEDPRQKKFDFVEDGEK